MPKYGSLSADGISGRGVWNLYKLHVAPPLRFKTAMHSTCSVKAFKQESSIFVEQGVIQGGGKGGISPPQPTFPPP